MSLFLCLINRIFYSNSIFSLSIALSCRNFILSLWACNFSWSCSFKSISSSLSLMPLRVEIGDFKSSPSSASSSSSPVRPPYYLVYLDKASGLFTLKRSSRTSSYFFLFSKILLRFNNSFYFRRRAISSYRLSSDFF